MLIFREPLPPKRLAGHLVAIIVRILSRTQRKMATFLGWPLCSGLQAHFLSLSRYPVSFGKRIECFKYISCPASQSLQQSKGDFTRVFPKQVPINTFQDRKGRLDDSNPDDSSCSNKKEKKQKQFKWMICVHRNPLSYEGL